MCFLGKRLVKITTGFIALLVKLPFLPLREARISDSFIFRPLSELYHSPLTSVKLFVCVLFLFILSNIEIYILAKLFRPEGNVCVAKEVLSVQVVEVGSQNGPCECPRD